MASCSEICGSEQSERAPNPTESGCHRYGVRSYLHHFYEECTASVWERRNEDFQTQRSPRWWSSGLWKVPGSLHILAVEHDKIIMFGMHYAIAS